MLALFGKLLDWFKSLFWKEEMELTLVGLQYSGKTTFVNVIAVSVSCISTVVGFKINQNYSFTYIITYIKIYFLVLMAIHESF